MRQPVLAEHRRPRLLVTRARHQQSAFIKSVEAIGFDTVSLPCIAIEALDFDLDSIPGKARWLVFISANAVDAFARALQAAGREWPATDMHAIGPATTAALEAHGQRVSHTAPPPYNSEAWLASVATLPLPEHASVIKGEGGRDRLAPGLHALGVDARNVDVYRRHLPAADDATLFNAFLTQAPDIISVTSDAVLHNLMTLAGPHHGARLLTLPLVVNSARCATLARKLGFDQPARVATPPGNAGQRRCLEAWLAEWIANSAGHRTLTNQ